jgi:hypothetical protein
MKKIHLVWIGAISIAIILGAYFLVSMTDPSIPKQDTVPTQNTVTPAPTQTPNPSTLTEYKACLDRANDSRAPQEFIDEDIRECERIYQP